MPLLDVQQAALEARRHRFRAVGDIELQENASDALLDRAFGDAQHRGDFVIGKSAPQQVERFDFARREPFVQAAAHANHSSRASVDSSV